MEVQEDSDQWLHALGGNLLKSQDDLLGAAIEGIHRGADDGVISGIRQCRPRGLGELHSALKAFDNASPENEHRS